jgi:cytochrome c2
LEWNVKRLAAYFMFAYDLFALSGIGAAQDLAADETSFRKCRACRAVGVGAKDRSGGPQLNGLVGRQAGTAAGYQYSLPVKNAGLAFDEASFAAFIANSREKIPGNKMVVRASRTKPKLPNSGLISHFNVDGTLK